MKKKNKPKRPYNPKVQCTAKSKQTKERCKRPAVKGKDKCRYHGGATPLRKYGSHTKYPDAFPTLAKKLQEIEENPRLVSSEELLKKFVAIGEVIYDAIKDDPDLANNPARKDYAEILAIAINRAAMVEEIKMKQGYYWNLTQITEWINSRLLPAVDDCILSDKRDEFWKRVEIIDMKKIK